MLHFDFIQELCGLKVALHRPEKTSRIHVCYSEVCPILFNEITEVTVQRIPASIYFTIGIYVSVFFVWTMLEKTSIGFWLNTWRVLFISIFIDLILFLIFFPSWTFQLTFYLQHKSKFCRKGRSCLPQRCCSVICACLSCSFKEELLKHLI